MTEPEYEVLREVWRIVERRDGAIFRTEYVEQRWIPFGSGTQQGDELYVPVSNPDGMTIRRKR